MLPTPSRFTGSRLLAVGGAKPRHPVHLLHALRVLVLLPATAVQHVDLAHENEVDRVRRVALVEDEVLLLLHLDVQAADQLVQLRVGELAYVLEVQVDHELFKLLLYPGDVLVQVTMVV